MFPALLHFYCSTKYILHPVPVIPETYPNTFNDTLHQYFIAYNKTNEFSLKEENKTYKS